MTPLGPGEGYRASLENEMYELVARNAAVMRAWLQVQHKATRQNLADFEMELHALAQCTSSAHIYVMQAIDGVRSRERAAVVAPETAAA